MWTRSVVILLDLEVRWWMLVIVFSVRPSSTSAHSAGVGREGGWYSWLCSFYRSERPLARTADPDEKSGQAKCTLRAPMEAEMKVAALKKVGGFNVAAPAASR